MKKLLLFTTALIFTAGVFAQTWCPPGAKWHFKRGMPNSNPGIDGVMALVYTGDSVVLGINCKKLVATFTGKTGGSGSPVVTQNFNTYLTHSSNNVIFLYNSANNVFDTVVDFNANIGNMWRRPGPNAQAGGCNARRMFIVTDTGHVQVNNFNLKSITVTYTSTINYGQGPISILRQYDFTERLLFTYAGYESIYNLFPTSCEVDGLIAELPNTWLRCYEDDTFPLYNKGNVGCSSLTGIKTLQANAGHITMYPNPASDYITVEWPETQHYELRLSDLLGRPLPINIIENASATRIDLGSLNAGIYFIQVYQNGQAMAIEKVIKQ